MATTAQKEALRRDEIAKLAKFLSNNATISGITPLELATQLYDRLGISYKDEHGRYISVTEAEATEEDGGTATSGATGGDDSPGASGA